MNKFKRSVTGVPVGNLIGQKFHYLTVIRLLPGSFVRSSRICPPQGRVRSGPQDVQSLIHTTRL